MSSIAYLGPSGTFTEIALNTYLEKSNLNIKKISCSSFSHCFSMLSSGNVDKIFIPIENSLGGDVASVFDELMTCGDHVSITGETHMRIEQSLLRYKEHVNEPITDIYAHEQSVYQCRNYIQKNFSESIIHYCSSNAVSAKKVSSDNDRYGTACIGHKRLVAFYPLTLVEENVNDVVDNVTRFIIISTDATLSTGNDRTSFMFSTFKDQPGSLCNILLELSQRSISLTRITSRPSKKMLGDYVFYIDCCGHIQDEILSDCLDSIQSKSSYYKFLGSYKQGEEYA